MNFLYQLISIISLSGDLLFSVECSQKYAKNGGFAIWWNNHPIGGYGFTVRLVSFLFLFLLVLFCKQIFMMANDWSILFLLLWGWRKRVFCWNECNLYSWKWNVLDVPSKKFLMFEKLLDLFRMKLPKESYKASLAFSMAFSLACCYECHLLTVG